MDTFTTNPLGDDAMGWALPRRDALKMLGLLGVAAAASGCTPLRIALRAYPRLYDTDPAVTTGILRAFVTAVIPGAPENDPHLVRAFADPALPFAPYRAYFASD